MGNFNTETRYNSEILNEDIKTLVTVGKLSKTDGIDFEIFLANTNLAKSEKATLLTFIDKIACL
jgi:hypothetical protein